MLMRYFGGAIGDPNAHLPDVDESNDIEEEYETIARSGVVENAADDPESEEDNDMDGLDEDESDDDSDDDNSDDDDDDDDGYLSL